MGKAEPLADEFFKSDAPLYVPIRYKHIACSKGKDSCLIVTRFPTHWKYMCHRCGVSGVRVIDNASPIEVVKIWEANKNKGSQIVKEVVLPNDFTNKIPDVGMVWLMKYDISHDEIIKYNIGYSNSYKRIIFPIYEDNKLIYWQGRNTDSNDTSKPKWINVKQTGRSNIYFKSADDDSSKIVIVEDILSAIKVGRITTSYALLGSYIPDSLILSLSTIPKVHVHLWLDGDKRLYAINSAMRMRNYGMTTHVHITERDPKELTEEEIIEKIGMGA